MLALLAAATPSPPAPPSAGPPLPAPDVIGPAGEWLLPALLLAVALALDYSAAGANARRDRVAMLLTYTAVLGFVGIYGWSDDIRRTVGASWSAVVLGSLAAVVLHLLMVHVAMPDTTEWGKRSRAFLQGRAGFSSKESTAVGRINTRLHIWAAVTAASYVLSRGPSAWFPEHIAGALNRASGWAGGHLIYWLGGGWW